MNDYGHFRSPFKVPEETLNEIGLFLKAIAVFEAVNSLPLMILLDGKSNAFYCECHITATNLLNNHDIDAVIDPELQEEFRANRELEPSNYYFLKMVEDAKKHRTFCDIVIEYNHDYNGNIPLKILGGQHRMEAIKRAKEEDGIDEIHGIRVYFGLNKDQRAELMKISNTNISVSSDLRDRIEEQRLEPAGMLRNFCYETGLLKEGEDFGDKRRYEEEFSPTVKAIRSFVVNFYKGRNYKGDIDKDAVVPYMCESGREADPEYLKIFYRFSPKGRFDDVDLISAAKNFALLHDTQFKNANTIEGSAKKQYKVKAFNLSMVTSWAFAAGVLNNYAERLKKLYSLPLLCGSDDPLNARAMARAHHRNDPDAYRGLGTRDDFKERGDCFAYGSNIQALISQKLQNKCATPQ